MNKPTINGIDVSECGYYNKDNEPYCCEIWDNECEAQDCYFKQRNRYFKQLKRLQEENEELKEKIKSEKYIKENALQEATKYSMKCGEFRQALEEIKILVKNYCNACDEFKVKTYKNKNDCLYCNYGFIKRKINEAFSNE